MKAQLDKVSIEGFKKIRKAEFPLSNLNILVGANSSGKSSVIQAIHFASCVIRQVPRIERSKPNTIAVEQLDYLPSNFYKLLCHRKEWGNKMGTPSSKVRLSFNHSDAGMVAADCEIRSARNAGISVKGSVAQSLVNMLRRKERFFSAYIPGISGIPNREEKRTQKVVQKSCSFGDSNVVLRNVLLLLKEQDDNNLRVIEKFLGELIGNISIYISHDETQDLFIECTVEFDGVQRPLELMGTGHLQLLQIASYLLLFRPGVLLVDEPDTHLHPDVQERLPRLLARVSEKLGTRVILTTHSPFLLRGAPVDASVFWMEDGSTASFSREASELTLGWGAFGKKILLVSEDRNTWLLKKLVGQWPELERQIAFVPGYGYSNLVTPQQAYELKEALGHKFEILVHRDRDALTDEEVHVLREMYEQKDVHLWMTDDSDLEAYFCCPKAIAQTAGLTEEEATKQVEGILSKHHKVISDQFESQRKAHNEELYSQGGSPSNYEVWAALQDRPLRGAKGKFVFKQIKNAVGQQKFSEECVIQSDFCPSLAQSLYSCCSKLVQ